LLIVFLALLATALVPAQAEAQSAYATRVEAAVADGGARVVNYYYLYYFIGGIDQIPGNCVADDGAGALGPSNLWNFQTNPGEGASGWLNGSGSLTLGFDNYLQNGAGDDLVIHHIGNGSTAGTSQARVQVSADGITWTVLGELPRAALNSWQVSTSFDFTAKGVAGANYVRIEKSGTCAEGEDCYLFIDAVEGRHPGTAPRPVVSLGSGNPAQAPLAPVFEAAHWDPGSGYSHSKTQWQIGTSAAFSSLVVDRTGATDLISFSLPNYLLEPETDYYCRARFFDGSNTPSLWSDPLAFTTGTGTTQQAAVYAGRVIAAVGGTSYNGSAYPVVKDQSGAWPTYEADGGVHALGEPDYDAGGFASGWSHWGGHLILGFDTPVTNLSGADLVIHHWGPGARDAAGSTTYVYASANQVEWALLGELSRSNRGIITTDSYDLANAGLDEASYVKIVKNYNGTDTRECGKYIDAVTGNPPLVQGGEVADNGTLEGDWTAADVAAGRVKFVNPVVDGGIDAARQVGIQTGTGTITDVRSVDPTTLPAGANRPAALPLGLVRFKVAVPAGGQAQVTIHLPVALAADARWYKYDDTNGWQDYTGAGYAALAGPRTVVLQLEDGGHGDADGTANGVIVDPGGPGGALAATGTTVTLTGADADTSASGGCFIATAAFGSPSERHVRVLRRFRDAFLLPCPPGRAFVHFYYRFSPPLAEWIAHHDRLRAAVRWLLLPAAAASALALEIGPLTLLLTGTGLVLLVLAGRGLCRNAHRPGRVLPRMVA